MFDFNQMRCFVAVAEELHFGKAAVRLNMTQPPLSRQIQILERILDVQLLERTSRSVKLTSAGRGFLPEARRMMKMAEGATQLAKRMHAGKTGSLHIAFTAASADGCLPPFIVNAMDGMRDVEFALGEMGANDLWEALLNGRTDIGLMRPPLRHEGFEAISVQSEALLAALPEASPLAAADSVGLESLCNHPFVMYDQNEARYLHDTVVSTFAQAGVGPRYIQHLSHVHSMLALVRGGLGCALVPASAAELGCRGVVFRPLDAPTQPRIELFMVWRKQHDNPVIDRLLQRIPRGPALVAA